jgi:hypothetical protein
MPPVNFVLWLVTFGHNIVSVKRFSYNGIFCNKKSVGGTLRIYVYGKA